MFIYHNAKGSLRLVNVIIYWTVYSVSCSNVYCVISFHVMLKEWHDLSCHSWSISLNIFANNGTWVMISDQNCVFRTDFGQKLYFLCRFWAQIKVIRAARQQWSQYFTLGYYPWYLRLISHLYLKYSILLIIF